MTKYSKKNSSGFTAIVVVLVLVVLGVVGYSAYQYQAKPNTPDTMENDEVTVDDINDGVYTSSVNGFSFSYPNDLFIEQSNVSFSKPYPAANYKTEDVCWYDGKEASYPQETILEGRLWLCISAHRSDESENDFYVKYRVDPSKPTRIGVRTIEQIDNESSKKYVLFSKTPEDSETEHSVTYESGWLTNDGLYLRIMMASDGDNEEFLVSQKAKFNSIVDSVKFSK